MKIRFSEKNILLFLFSVYFLVRLINLTKLPIFNDEATYLDWAYRQINLEGEFYHSVLHAKPPLYIWVVGLLRKIITDPLLAGRLVSVIAGSLTAFGLYKIAKDNFSKNAGFISIFLYTITPIFSFFDRQALMEASVATSGVWAFYFFQKMIKSNHPKYAAFTGITLGIGYLIKTTAIVFLFAFSAITLLEIAKNKKNIKLISANLIYVFLSFFLTITPLILHPAFWQTLDQNKKYIFTISELFQFPVTQWFVNLKDYLSIVFIYLNPIVAIAGLIIIFKSFKKGSQKIIHLSVMLFVGTGFLIFLERVTLVRHVSPFLPLFLLFAAINIAEKIDKKRLMGISLLIASSIPSLILTLLLVFSPLTYFNTLDKLTNKSQKKDYVTFWSSGYGFDEVRNYLETISANQTILVGVRLDAGIPENAVFTYFSGSKNVIPTYLDTQLFANFSDFECLGSEIPVYFVSRDNHMGGLQNYFKQVKKVYKPEGKHYIGIHKLKEDCQGKTLKLI